MSALERELAALAPELRARLEARGFDAAQLVRWASLLGSDPLERNRLRGRVELVPDAMIEAPPAAASEIEQACRVRGEQALARGELAVCILAGGMATRMGGVVKALVEVVEGRTFLDLQLEELGALERRYGRAPPLWLMTSEPTDGPIRAALERGGINRARVATFEQFVSLRLTPDGALWRDEHGLPSPYATGHGDLPDALARSGLCRAFRARGGTTVWIRNLDNLGARVDPVLLGQHLASDAALSVELVDKEPGDKGGGPVLLDGRPIVAEHFRLPRDFDGERVPVFNTNTFLVDAAALDGLRVDWTYLEVHKQVGGTTAVQFERLIGEMSTALTPRFVRVPRHGDGSRFLPAKDPQDLERLRALLERQPASASW